MFSTAERPERSSVFVISRQMPSSRFASTARRTGSRRRARRQRGHRLALQQVVAERVDGRRPAGRYDDRRRRLLDDAGPVDRAARRPGRRRDRRGVRPRRRPSATSVAGVGPGARRRSARAGAASRLGRAERRRGPSSTGTRRTGPAPRRRTLARARGGSRRPAWSTAASLSTRLVRAAAPRAPRPGRGSAPRRRAPCGRAAAGVPKRSKNSSSRSSQLRQRLRSRLPRRTPFVSARRLTLNSVTMSENWPPHADSAAAVRGTSDPAAAELLGDRARSSSPPAPPPATTSPRADRRPALIVISRIALTMCSLATARIAYAASLGAEPERLGDRRARSPPAPRRRRASIRPPRK